MKHSLEEELQLKRFLLGELSEGEQSEVEERLFADPKYFSQFRAAEDELIDEYLYGDLDGSEKERFEKHFVTTPERRESLRVARALQQYIEKKGSSAVMEFVDKVPAPRPAKRSILEILGISGTAPRFAMTAAMILIVAVVVWLAVRTRPNPVPLNAGTNVQPSPEQIAQAGPGQNQNNNQNSGVEPPNGNRSGDGGKDAGNSRTPRQPSARYSFLILPIRQVRGEGGVNKIALPADAGIVNLKIPLIEEGYDTYRVVLQTNSEKQVKSWSNLKPANESTGQTLSIDIPARSLRQQKYRLELSGLSNNENPKVISTFYFQVQD